MTGIYLKLFWYKGFVPEKHCLIRLGQCKSTQYNQFKRQLELQLKKEKTLRVKKKTIKGMKETSPEIRWPVHHLSTLKQRKVRAGPEFQAC